MAKYSIIWIEGLSVASGEKVKSLTKDGFSYTTKMTEALRIKKKGIPFICDYMKLHGISESVIENPTTFIGVNYAPKGTMANLLQF